MTELTSDQRRLAADNIPLARFLARLVWERNSDDLELDEVTAVAYQGLLTAASKFDPGHDMIRPGHIDNGKAFAGFARQRIIGSIIDWQRGADHVQRTYRKLYKDFVAAGHGNGATIEDLVLASGESETKIREVIRAVEQPALSLSMPTGIEDKTLGDDLRAEQSVEASAEALAMLRSARDRLAALPELQRVIVSLRYTRGIELQAIATELGMSLALVREAHQSAVIEIMYSMKDQL